jgi:spoIIIJ-associated protein
VAKALQQLGLARDQVEVQVLSEGRSGLFGLGGEAAKVLVTPRAAAAVAAPTAATGMEEAEEEAGEDLELGAGRPERSHATRQEIIDGAEAVLSEMLRLMGLRAKLNVQKPGPTDGAAVAHIDILGEDLGLLIGRRGDTLVNLQYIVNLILARRFQTHAIVSLDVEGYRRRREGSLRNLAMRMADRVRSSGQPITIEPMPANERRIVHLTLSKDPDVRTESVGDGDDRKVMILPKDY